MYPERATPRSYLSGNTVSGRVSPCPHCGWPMEFIVGKGTFFCHYCRQYSVSRYMSADAAYPPPGGPINPPSSKGNVRFVIVIVIVVIISIIISATLISSIIYDPYINNPGPNTPRGHMAINGNSTTHFTATVQIMDRQGLDVELAEYFLVAADGSLVASGRVSNIIGRDIEESWVNLSFLDTDRDNRISANDNFYLKGTGNGGICGSGFTFTIKFTETDEVVMKQNTP